MSPFLPLRPKRKVQNAQMERIVEYMERYPLLRSGKISSIFTKAQKMTLWAQLAAEVNEMAGPKKSLYKWRKTWMDFKSYVKDRARTIHQQSLKASPLVETPRLGFLAQRVIAMMNMTFDTEEPQNLPEIDWTSVMSQLPGYRVVRVLDGNFENLTDYQNVLEELNSDVGTSEPVVKVEAERLPHQQLSETGIMIKTVHAGVADISRGENVLQKKSNLENQKSLSIKQDKVANSIEKNITVSRTDDESSNFQKESQLENSESVMEVEDEIPVQPEGIVPETIQGVVRDINGKEIRPYRKQRTLKHQISVSKYEKAKEKAKILQIKDPLVFEIKDLQGNTSTENQKKNDRTPNELCISQGKNDPTNSEPVEQTKNVENGAIEENICETRTAPTAADNVKNNKENPIYVHEMVNNKENPNYAREMVVVQRETNEILRGQNETLKMMTHAFNRIADALYIISAKTD